MYRVAYESIHKARHGGGPTLIRAVSFPAPQISKAHHPKHADAVARMEGYLTAKGLFSPSVETKSDRSVQPGSGLGPRGDEETGLTQIVLERAGILD